MPEARLHEADGDGEHRDQHREDAQEHRSQAAVRQIERTRPDQDQAEEQHADHRRVDRAAALLGPVDVVEVEPERELVDRQPDADAEQEGAELVDRVDGEAGEADRAGGDHQHDSEHEVVDVEAALADDRARPPRHAGAAHQAGGEPDEPERQDDPEQDQEQPLAVVLDELVVPEVREDRCGLDHAGASPAISGIVTKR